MAGGGSGCSSAPVSQASDEANKAEKPVQFPTTPPAAAVNATAKSPYEAAIFSNSAGDEDYNGLYNTFSFKSTVHNATVTLAVLQEQARYYQWEDAKLLDERTRALKTCENNTDIFVSFFTPDHKNDNLADAKTIWRVFLDVGGKRFQGKAKKSKKLLAELQVLYPYHTRWNTPYFMSFPVATEVIDRQPATLTITGPLGSRSVIFNPPMK
jgi:hypothetical protein